MLRATHGHLASKNEKKRQKNILTVVWSHDRGHSGQGGLLLVCWAVYVNTQELVWWLYTHARMHTNCTQHSHKHMHPRTHATLTRTHAATHARNTHAHTHTCMHTPVHHTTNTHSHAQVLYTCMRTHPALTDTYTTRDSRTRVGALSRLRKFVFIWPFPYANWQMGPTRNMVNLTSQHGATQTIWPVNRMQSDAKLWASDRIIIAKCI